MAKKASKKRGTSPKKSKSKSPKRSKKEKTESVKSVDETKKSEEAVPKSESRTSGETSSKSKSPKRGRSKKKKSKKGGESEEKKSKSGKGEKSKSGKKGKKGKKKKLSKSEREAKKKQAEAEAKEALRREEEDKIRIAEENLKRGDQLIETGEIFKANEKVVYAHLKQQARDLEWENYIACRGTPDVSSLIDVNSYMTEWTYELTKLNLDRVLAYTPSILIVVEELKELLELPPEHIRVENIHGLGLMFHEFKERQQEFLDDGTYHIIEDLSELYDPEVGVFEDIRSSQKQEVVHALWGNLFTTPENGSHEYTDLGVKFRIPDSLVMTPGIYRLLQTAYDHYSDLSNSYYPPGIESHLKQSILNWILKKLEDKQGKSVLQSPEDLSKHEEEGDESGKKKKKKKSKKGKKKKKSKKGKKKGKKGKSETTTESDSDEADESDWADLTEEEKKIKREERRLAKKKNKKKKKKRKGKKGKKGKKKKGGKSSSSGKSGTTGTTTTTEGETTATEDDSEYETEEYETEEDEESHDDRIKRKKRKDTKIVEEPSKNESRAERKARRRKEQEERERADEDFDFDFAEKKRGGNKGEGKEKNLYDDDDDEEPLSKKKASKPDVAGEDGESDGKKRKKGKADTTDESMEGEGETENEGDEKKKLKVKKSKSKSKGKSKKKGKKGKKSKGKKKGKKKKKSKNKGSKSRSKSTSKSTSQSRSPSSTNQTESPASKSESESGKRKGRGRSKGKKGKSKEGSKSGKGKSKSKSKSGSKKGKEKSPKSKSSGGSKSNKKKGSKSKSTSKSKSRSGSSKPARGRSKGPKSKSKSKKGKKGSKSKSKSKKGTKGSKSTSKSKSKSKSGSKKRKGKKSRKGRSRKGKKGKKSKSKKKKKKAAGETAKDRERNEKKAFIVEVEEDELNLREFAVQAGSFNFKMLQVPPQPKERGDWTLRMIESERYIKEVPFEVVYEELEPPNIDEEYKNSPEGLQDAANEEEKKKLNDLNLGLLPDVNLQAQAEAEAELAERKKKLEEELMEKFRAEKEARTNKLISLTIQLPKTVLWFEAPVVVRWDEERRLWSKDGFHSLQFNPDTSELSFYATSFGIFGLASTRWVNMPYQNWEFEPLEPNMGKFTLTTSKVTLEFTIKDDVICLSALKNAPQSELVEAALLNVYMTPVHLIKALRLHGLDVFPEFDSYAYMDGVLIKTPDVESHLNQCMALIAPAYKMSWSKWNQHVRRDKIIFQMQEKEDSGEPLMMMCDFRTCYAINSTETSTKLSEERVGAMEYCADLVQYINQVASISAKHEMTTASPPYVETIRLLISAIRPLSFA